MTVLGWRLMGWRSSGGLDSVARGDRFDGSFGSCQRSVDVTRCLVGGFGRGPVQAGCCSDGEPYRSSRWPGWESGGVDAGAFGGEQLVEGLVLAVVTGTGDVGTVPLAAAPDRRRARGRLRSPSCGWLSCTARRGFGAASGWLHHESVRRRVGDRSRAVAPPEFAATWQIGHCPAAWRNDARSPHSSGSFSGCSEYAVA